MPPRGTRRALLKAWLAAARNRDLATMLVVTHHAMGSRAFERVADRMATHPDVSLRPGARSLRVSAASGDPVLVRVRGRTLGGASPVIIAGPYAVESESQLEATAKQKSQEVDNTCKCA